MTFARSVVETAPIIRDRPTLPVGVVSAQSGLVGQVECGIVGAGATVPGLRAFPLLRRHDVNSLSARAMKG